MGINKFWIAVSILGLVAEVHGAISWTFVDGAAPVVNTDHQYTTSGTATPNITKLYAAPLANQASWGQSTGAGDPGPYSAVIADFSSNVTGKMQLTNSYGTSSGRFTFALDSATSGPITFRFAYNHEITSIPDNEVVGSFNSASTFEIRQNQSISFDYGIDVELINTSQTLLAMFGNATPTAINWEGGSGSDWNQIGGAGITIDGLVGANTLQTTVSSSAAGAAGFEIVDDTRGDSSLVQKGWEFTIDPGANTFAAGTKWNFTFDGMRRLAARSVPEPSSLILGMLGLPLIFLRRRKS